MAKEILFDIEAREKLKAGVDALANAVKSNVGTKRKKRYYWTQIWGPSYYKRWCTL